LHHGKRDRLSGRKIKKKEKRSVQIKLRKSEQKGKIKSNLRIRRDKETRLVVGTLALGNDPIEVKLESVKPVVEFCK
jgi:hypothetical protein